LGVSPLAKNLFDSLGERLYNLAKKVLILFIMLLRLELASHLGQDSLT
jgi:hypothetical protein